MKRVSVVSSRDHTGMPLATLAMKRVSKQHKRQRRDRSFQSLGTRSRTAFEHGKPRSGETARYQTRFHHTRPLPLGNRISFRLNGCRFILKLYISCWIFSTPLCACWPILDSGTGGTRPQWVRHDVRSYHTSLLSETSSRLLCSRN
jgi:hypothetical protein